MHYALPVEKWITQGVRVEEDRRRRNGCNACPVGNCFSLFQRRANAIFQRNENKKSLTRLFCSAAGDENQSITNAQGRKEGNSIHNYASMACVCDYWRSKSHDPINMEGGGARLLMNFSGLGLLFLLPTVRDWIDRLDFVYIIRNGGTAGNWGRKKEQTEKCNQIKS